MSIGTECVGDVLTFRRGARLATSPSQGLLHDQQVSNTIYLVCSKDLEAQPA